MGEGRRVNGRGKVLVQISESLPRPADEEATTIVLGEGGVEITVSAVVFEGRDGREGCGRGVGGTFVSIP